MDNNNDKSSKSHLLEKFNVKHYRMIHKDLSNMSDECLIDHYINHGIKENRIAKLDLPSNFNVQHYKIINKDLARMTDEDAIIHYVLHGKKERRLYYIPNYDADNSLQNIEKIKNMKNSVFIICHDSQLTGAPIFSYELALYFEKNNIFNNVLMFDVMYSEKLEKMYYKKLKHCPIFYFNDIEILKKYATILNPIMIYSNSLTIILESLEKWTSFLSKTVFHFHETIQSVIENKHVYKNTKTLPKDQKLYVVSDAIKCAFVEHFDFTNINVFPPFLPKSKLDIINSKNHQTLNSLSNLNIDLSKITFGGCGTIGFRKGYDIFKKISELLPMYNFIWIGGEKDTNILNNNFYQICETNDPYMYINILDYFFLSSRSDPCPIVVLEALYLKIPCIVLDKNITYNHNLNDDYYVIKNHNNDFNIILEFIQNMNLKKNTYPQHLRDYIMNNFMTPKLFDCIIYKKTECLKKISDDFKMVKQRGYRKLVMYNNTKCVDLDANQIAKISQNKNNIALLICLFNVKDFEYYKNIINYVKFVHQNKIDIVLVVNTGETYKNSDFKTCGYFHTFGLDWKLSSYALYKQYYDLPHDDIIFVPNKGYDVGMFIVGLKFMSFFNYQYVVHLHSKTNDLWRDAIFKIYNYDISQLNCDTVISNLFYSQFDINNSLLTPLILKLPNLKIESDTFYFNVGKVFSTKVEHLTYFIENFYEIYQMLTDIYTNDVYWQNCMTNETIFMKCYNTYKNCIFNLPIDIKSHQLMKDKVALNYIDLFKKGSRGIPDCQIEHAIERILGYFICLNKKIFFAI